MSADQYADWQSLERYACRWGMGALTRHERAMLRKLRGLAEAERRRKGVLA